MPLPRWLCLVVLISLAPACAAPPVSRVGDRPAVVVMISVEQLRADLVTRYASYYTDGFKRLIDQGAYFDAVHDHALVGNGAGPCHALDGSGLSATSCAAAWQSG